MNSSFAARAHREHGLPAVSLHLFASALKELRGDSAPTPSLQNFQANRTWLLQSIIRASAVLERMVVWPVWAAITRPMATDTAIPSRAKRMISMIGKRRSAMDLMSISMLHIGALPGELLAVPRLS
jgi:hypothetical protein